jgi:hypothetical protein
MCDGDIKRKLKVVKMKKGDLACLVSLLQHEWENLGCADQCKWPRKVRVVLR